MEKRALLAIALSIGILLLWQAWFVPSPSSPPAPGPAGPGSGPAATSSSLPTGGGEAPRAAAEGAGSVVVPRATAPVGAERGADIATPRHRVTLRPDGTVGAWTLRYRGEKGLLVGKTLGALSVVLIRPGAPPEILGLRPATGEVTLGPGRAEDTLVLTGGSADGLRVRHTLRFRADSYVVDSRLRLEGGGAGPVSAAVYWTGPVALAGAKAGDAWVTLGEGADHQQLLGRILVQPGGQGLTVFDAPAPALRDPKEAPGGPELKDPQLVAGAVVGGERGWAALENDYFIAAVIADGGAQLFRARERDLTTVGLVFPDLKLGAGQSWEGGGRLYVGPKEWNQLTALGVGLEEAQARNYGYFLWMPWAPMWWFCVPLLWVMNLFGTRLPGENYGVAIILLTVLVKLLFYPLTQKSMSSMKQMQALQPQVNALKSKYRSDPQRFQREQMELFRKHRVNPMGGCLPMVVQVPIFYALYLTLQYSVELQGAPFLLWIADLSKKDPYYVLPILMGISMLVQQKMTPTVGDPRQARIMLIMPVIFTFMFLEFPTGLVLYWLVNNVLSVAQQYLIDRAAARAKSADLEERPGKDARRG